MPAHQISNALSGLYEGVQGIVDDLASEGGAAGTPKVELTRPSDEKFGDFATNVALLLAPVLRTDPRSVATKVAERAAELPGVASVDVAGPGFVNFVLDDAWFADSLSSVLEAGDRWGADVVKQPQKILLEFVSANPTGPITAASARHAAYGDSLARVMRYAGHEVATEYYFNDAGRQVELFGQSLKARAEGDAVPEGGYEGEYVLQLARKLALPDGTDAAEWGHRGVAAMLEQIKQELHAVRVDFDRFQSERELHDTGAVDAALVDVRNAGQAYEDDGATWLRTTSFGDDKDRVLVRSDGTPTYFAADVAYLKHKLDRGCDTALYVLGADHHGYVGRLKAAAAALGSSPEHVEVVIMQMVHLHESGEQKKMSKRRGDIVTIDDLVEKIGVDAVRYSMLQRSHDQTLDIDMDLMAEASAKNPVYYVQYAHARISSIVRKVSDDLGAAVVADAESSSVDLSGGLTLHPSERRLVKRLAELPVFVQEAAERRAPHKITTYAHELASEFTQFYRDCRVVGDGVEPAETKLRLQLCFAAKIGIARSLDLVGVTAPDRM
jgi:arginyl-tRNA synthetase